MGGALGREGRSRALCHFCERCDRIWGLPVPGSEGLGFGKWHAWVRCTKSWKFFLKDLTFLKFGPAQPIMARQLYHMKNWKSILFLWNFFTKNFHNFQFDKKNLHFVSEKKEWFFHSLFSRLLKNKPYVFHKFWKQFHYLPTVLVKHLHVGLKDFQYLKHFSVIQ